VQMLTATPQPSLFIAKAASIAIFFLQALLTAFSFLNHLIHSGIPFPVLADSSNVSILGLSLRAPPLRAEVRHPQINGLADNQDIANRKDQRILERLIITLGDTQDHQVFSGTNFKFYRADKITDIFNNNHIQFVRRQISKCHSFKSHVKYIARFPLSASEKLKYPVHRTGYLSFSAPVKSQPADLHEKPIENVDSENILSKLLKRAQYCSFT